MGEKSMMAAAMAQGRTVAEAKFDAWWRNRPEGIPDGIEAHMRLAFTCGLLDGMQSAHQALEMRAGIKFDQDGNPYLAATPKAAP